MIFMGQNLSLLMLLSSVTTSSSTTSIIVRCFFFLCFTKANSCNTKTNKIESQFYHKYNTKTKCTLDYMTYFELLDVLEAFIFLEVVCIGEGSSSNFSSSASSDSLWYPPVSLSNSSFSRSNMPLFTGSFLLTSG